MRAAGHAGLIVLAFLATSSGAFAQTPAGIDTRRSGSEFMGPSTQAMQKDDALNPAMLWVKEGESLWSQPVAPSGKACVACHAAASSSMRGVAARYPAFDERLLRPVTLGQRINQCRQHHQQSAPLRAESQELLSLETYVAFQSRGLPLAPPADERLAPYRRQGEQRFMQRMGQLNLSCAQCHDNHAGGRLGSSVIPQAHPTGYPVYRLEWQALGSLQRRLRGCMSGVRAEPFAYGAQELVELELYLAARAKGLPGETPGVRP
ncbi:sulfur oxidation c-type cytochrome SoxA [Polaromonas eurypsychrophila]|uniref:SoxAX cytochrome complex subunit A n=1 Tax=Polaromonas eurypsychrophila TaxID=1614635 RepID=A0A916WGK6_9BURK|nr:sulfur oxidation c-type cytochrome SoxA [Polaromonas eurypsychrophila]GGA98948.1 SoxAX cytochrome complex subunit A [Polaromonas eurypsychrophila]